jgi:uncharacterized membrane protein
MSRESLLVLLGVIIALSPYLGIPVVWLAVILPLLGVAIAVIGASLRARRFFASETFHDTPHS